MPASLLTEILFRGLFEIVFYGLGYLIGWVVVPVFSLGHFTVEPWDFKPRSRSKGRRGRPGPRMVSADAATAIGLVTLVAACVLAYFVWRAASA